MQVYSTKTFRPPFRDQLCCFCGGKPSMVSVSTPISCKSKEDIAGPFCNLDCIQKYQKSRQYCIYCGDLVEDGYIFDKEPSDTHMDTRVLCKRCEVENRDNITDKYRRCHSISF